MVVTPITAAQGKFDLKNASPALELGSRLLLCSVNKYKLNAVML